MKITTATVIIGTALIALTISGCSSASPSDGNAADQGGEIAYVPPLSDSPFFATIGCGVKDAVEDAGYTFYQQAPPSFDAALQTQIVQAVSQRDPAAMVVDVVATDQLVPALETAARSTTVVTSLEPIVFDGQSGAVEFDQAEFGRLQAQALIDAIGESGNVFLLDYQAGSATLDQRAEGALEELSKYPGINVVGHEYAVGDATRAAQLTAAVLQSTPDLAGVITTDVYSTPGVINAVAEAGKADEVKIVSADLVDSTVQQVKDGTIVAFVASKNYELGVKSGEAAIAALEGEDLEIPTFVEDAYLTITADNIDLASDPVYAARSC